MDEKTKAKSLAASDATWTPDMVMNEQNSNAQIDASDYQCENCIGMSEHGCYCMAMGCPAPCMPPAVSRDNATMEDANV